MDEAIKEDLKTGDCFCNTCGTDMKWWLQLTKRNHIYILDNGDVCCSRKCYVEYAIAFHSPKIFNNSILQEDSHG